MKSPLENILYPPPVLKEMSYGIGGQKHEDHLFGPDFDKNGKIRKLGGTGLDGYIINPKTGESWGVEAGLPSKDFNQGRIKYENGKWNATAKNEDFKKELHSIELEDHDGKGLPSHLETHYGHGHEPKERERISSSTGKTKVQKFNASGAAIHERGEMHLTHMDVGAVNNQYNKAGKKYVAIAGKGLFHTGEDHAGVDVPEFGTRDNPKWGLYARIRHKDGQGAIGQQMHPTDYKIHEPTQTAGGMIDHVTSKGLLFGRTPKGINRKHLEASGYQGPTDHLLLHDED